MATLMAGAFVLGAVSSWLLGFAPFFLALLVAVVLGAATALVRGIPQGELLYSALAMLMTGQLAYGLGLIGQAGVARLGLPRFRPDASRRDTAGLVPSSSAPEPSRSPRRGNAPASSSGTARPVAPPR